MYLFNIVFSGGDIGIARISKNCHWNVLSASGSMGMLYF